MIKPGVLVVSPHPDDETLGAGGTLLRFKQEGRPIHWLNFTNMSLAAGFGDMEVKMRKKAIEKVKKMYAFDGFFDLALAPAGLDGYSKKELVKQAGAFLQKIKPATVIIPYSHDAHSDHRVVFEVMHACTKSFRAPFVREILMMEIISETEFTASKKGFFPNYFVDISAHLQKKLRIMRQYGSELGKHPFPRSLANLKALAVFRGAAAGCTFAESFVLLKKIR